MKHKTIQLFEHGKLRIGQVIDGIKFGENHFEALSKYSEKMPLPYYSLLHRGIKFNQYVGVIQAGDLTIEILPKADKSPTPDKKKWRNVLLDMLFACRLLKIKSISHANLFLKKHSILDLYISMFLDEVESLLHHGLAKKYRFTKANQKAWKGSLQFQQQVSKNIVHKERFYVRYQTYDRENIYNQLLYKTICLLPLLTKIPLLHNRIASVHLDFPEMPNLKVDEATFKKLSFDRKTERYRTALEIARLLLLHYHPDIKSGRNHVLALLFDMNQLWEGYIYYQLKKEGNGRFKVRGQAPKYFWNQRKIKPDIVLELNWTNIIIDTKWKIPNANRPSDADLKQVFVYNEYWEARLGILLYPQPEQQQGPTWLVGEYQARIKPSKCVVVKISILDADGKLDKTFALNLINKIEQQKNILCFPNEVQ